MKNWITVLGLYGILLSWPGPLQAVVIPTELIEKGGQPLSASPWGALIMGFVIGALVGIWIQKRTSSARSWRNNDEHE